MIWISVKDQLPENINNDFSEWCLAIDKYKNIFKTRYDYKYNQWMDKANIPEGNKVTHWMSLPNPPKQ